ncbi:MAG: hypothetical protein ACYTBZ_31590 [Planctomycetota bacterium]|jgi:hypothetical protein
MLPYFNLNTTSNSMVQRKSWKGVLAIAFLCLATYVFAFAGIAGAGTLDVDILNWAGVNQVQVEWGIETRICNNTPCAITDASLTNGTSVTVTGIPGAGYELYDWDGNIPQSYTTVVFKSLHIYI